MRKRHLIRFEELVDQNRRDLLNDEEALTQIDDKLYERAQKKDRLEKKRKRFQ
ncbi:FbpB family small basic protein [Shouchella lonarensis]|uniref:Fur-regulated basic protein B n=1 Tax=Shouchella lonarensis TaxID=1464122 RepID=A0A1G6GGQ2_9BACI|nr:FbpB family small basic protein [Shouchella lonarensis]SDB81003.1 Fur-regulated basic protein B [Shouchella lonarensis]